MASKLDNRAAVVRQFWADYLDSAVGKDRQVDGFDAAWGRMSQEARRLATRYAEACWTKIQRDQRDPTECIEAGVAALRSAMLYLTAPAHPCPPLRARFHVAVFRRMWEARSTGTAAELADWLVGQPWEDPPADFTQIVRLLRAWPERQPYPALPSLEDAARAARDEFDPRWWDPGAALAGGMPTKLLLEPATVELFAS